jgi:uncharacterized protein
MVAAKRKCSVVKIVSWVLVFSLFVGVSSFSGISYYVTAGFVGPYKPTEKQTLSIEEHARWLQEAGAQPVSFVTPDGMRLSGLMVLRPHARYTIVACHGYWRTKEDCWRVVKLFDDANIFLFDFRAHGESQGDLVSIGWHERSDVAAAYYFIRSNQCCSHMPIIGIGFSMGAVALAGAQAHEGLFDLIILDSSFDNLEAQIERVFSKKTGLPRWPFFWLSKHLYRFMVGAAMKDVDVVKWAHAIKIPTLVIHSQDDLFTPNFCSLSIYEALQGPKELWCASDASHALIIKKYEKEYKKRVEDFIKA